MGAGRPTQWRASDVTIREIYGLPRAVLDPIEPHRDHIASFTAGDDAVDEGTEAGAGILLSHQGFRDLFCTIESQRYVCAVAVACYLGVSMLTIERKLAQAFGNARTPWRIALASHPQGSPPSPALINARFRWSFVITELAPLVAVEMRRAQMQRQRQLHNANDRGRPRRSSLLRLCDSVDGLQYVLDARGRIVGALGQGHMSAAILVDTLNSGGRLLSLDPADALGMAWLTERARAPWAEAILESLARQSDALRRRIQEGRAATAAVMLRDRLPDLVSGRVGSAGSRSNPKLRR